MTDVQHRSDIVTLLERDHQSIEAMFSRFDAEPMSSWDQLFCDITHTLVAHEVAEELVVYPALRRDAPGGEQIADSCIHEQSAAEELLDVMERDGVEAPEFRTRLAELRRAVLAHAQHEEREVFPALRAVEDAGRREEIGQRYERAKSMAPTHPHPHAPDTPPGNVTLGPVTALVDRMRDAMSRD